MVTIIDFVKRQNREGKEFNALILQSGIELVKSKETGSYYATSKKASISSTFDDATCQNLIGQQIPGEIERMEVDEYDFLVPGTKKKIKLNHSYRYSAEPATITEVVG